MGHISAFIQANKRKIPGRFKDFQGQLFSVLSSNTLLNVKNEIEHPTLIFDDKKFQKLKQDKFKGFQALLDKLKGLSKTGIFALKFKAIQQTLYEP